MKYQPLRSKTGLQHKKFDGLNLGLELFSSTIRATNQALNENVDKVMIIPNFLICHRTFWVEGRFCVGAVDIQGGAKMSLPPRARGAVLRVAEVEVAVPIEAVVVRGHLPRVHGVHGALLGVGRRVILMPPCVFCIDNHE
jgi:hypothetical protein